MGTVDSEEVGTGCEDGRRRGRTYRRREGAVGGTLPRGKGRLFQGGREGSGWVRGEDTESGCTVTGPGGWDLPSTATGTGRNKSRHERSEGHYLSKQNKKFKGQTPSD